MKELSGRANAVLERYRAVESLRESEKSRLLELLQARSARGEVPRASVDLPPPSAVPRMGWLERVWSGPFAKIGVGAMGGVAIGALVVGAMRARPPLRAPRAVSYDDPGTLNHARPEPAPPAAVAPPADDSIAAPIEPSLKTHPKGPSSATRSVAPNAPKEAPPAGDTTNESTIDEEIRLLHRAQLSVRSNDPRRALALLDEHAAKFPSGKLADAREVTRMVALCDLGAHAAAREKAEHFLAEHPGSPFSDRVRRICADPAP